MKSIEDLEVQNKTVLVRTGFDVPIEQGRIKDDFRISVALPTLDHLVRQKAKIIVITHLGRPRGWDPSLSLAPVAALLAELLHRKFVEISQDAKRLPAYTIPHLYFFKGDFLQADRAALLSALEPGDIAVLENLRFYPGETENDENFARSLASFGEAYVNEAFSNSHREHASMTTLPRLLPAGAGFQIFKEVQSLSRVLVHPKKPLVVLMGGIKLADKAAGLKNLAKLADAVLLGGALANLFLKVRGFEIGKSAASEKNEEAMARELWRDFKEKIKLPIDVVVSTSQEGTAECVKLDKVKPHQMILDIGPTTIREYSGFLKQGRTLIWSGPLGFFEKKPFSHGTYALARLFASRTRGLAFGVAGGGETLEVIKNLDMASQIDHVSCGGGAMLEFLAGKTLPGLEVLKNDTL